MARDEQISREIGCDGFEVDAHAGCRPSHEFMQGKMFSYLGDKTIDGVTYPDGKEALSRLDDYNCLHFKTGVILGVSLPRYTPEYLERINRETTEPITYDGKTKTLYEWKQTQRRLENAIRKETDTYNMAKYSGNELLADRCREKIELYRSKYDDMCEKVGLTAKYERMEGVGERFARDVETGESFEVPKGMTYEQWKALQNNAGLTNNKKNDTITMREVVYVNSGAFYGALNPDSDSDFERCEIHAKKYYEEIRNRTSDVEAISKNTGFDIETITAVKQHLFFNKYDLGQDEPERFDPSYDIAVSWQNLIDGKIIENKDIILIKHEYHEYKLMNERGLSYREAHEITQKIYDYQSAVNEWRRNK